MFQCQSVWGSQKTITREVTYHVFMDDWWSNHAAIIVLTLHTTLRNYLVIRTHLGTSDGGYWWNCKWIFQIYRANEFFFSRFLASTTRAYDSTISIALAATTCWLLQATGVQDAICRKEINWVMQTTYNLQQPAILWKFWHGGAFEQFVLHFVVLCIIGKCWRQNKSLRSNDNCSSNSGKYKF